MSNTCPKSDNSGGGRSAGARPRHIATPGLLPPGLAAPLPPGPEAPRPAFPGTCITLCYNHCCYWLGAASSRNQSDGGRPPPRATLRRAAPLERGREVTNERKGRRESDHANGSRLAISSRSLTNSDLGEVIKAAAGDAPVLSRPEGSAGTGSHRREQDGGGLEGVVRRGGDERRCGRLSQGLLGAARAPAPPMPGAARQLCLQAGRATPGASGR
ncbi:uncharacterized protein LOC141950543 [Strix uralensis]|uniref:uncharacterized protein LOC141950543 n=1 Tax=Strix uralensis TaxID=36305 RepID=UPI003DA2921B